MGRRSKTPAAGRGLPQLWAPWRSTFVSARKRQAPCIFCAAHRSRDDRAHHVVARGTHVFAILNRYPYNNGHLMIAPSRHVGGLSSITPGEWVGPLRMSLELPRRLVQRLRPQGFNMGLNLGRVAGAGILGHLHLHIVPRWNGDTNFMPVLGATKIISQSLAELYELLTATTKRDGR